MATGTTYYTLAGHTVGMRTNDEVTWLISDHQGTAQASMADTTSQDYTRRYQTPYGEQRGNTAAWPNDKGYLGGTNDTTGLTHLGAREYDPALGRFVSVDPIMDLADPQQWNAYTYSNGSPITYSDPSGLRLSDVVEGNITQREVDAIRNGTYDKSASGPSEDTPTFQEWYEDETGTHVSNTQAFYDLQQGNPHSYYTVYGEYVCGTGSRQACLEWWDAYQAVGETSAGEAIIGAILGIEDAVRCIDGDKGSCAWAAAGVIPLAKLAKVAKALKALHHAENGLELVDLGSGYLRTPAGLIYGPGGKEGHRIFHIGSHASDSVNPHKAQHSIFIGQDSPLQLVDEAWLRRGAPEPGDPQTYVVPMGRTVGALGETSIRVIVRPNMEVISAYPWK